MTGFVRYLKPRTSQVLQKLLQGPARASSTSPFTSECPSLADNNSSKQRTFQYLLQYNHLSLPPGHLLPRQKSLLAYYGKSVKPPPGDVGVEEAGSVEELTTRSQKNEEKDKTLWQRFKWMYTNYWYVLLPVHVVTSSVWVGIFYAALRSGVDLAPIMERVNLKLPENAGYVALVYAMYKVATPARYFVTVTGTTLSIHYLQKMGVIKPVPSRQAIMSRYHQRRDQLRVKFEETKDKFQKIRDKQGGKYD